MSDAVERIRTGSISDELTDHLAEQTLKGKPLVLNRQEIPADEAARLLIESPPLDPQYRARLVRFQYERSGRLPLPAHLATCLRQDPDFAERVAATVSGGDFRVLERALDLSPPAAAVAAARGLIGTSARPGSPDREPLEGICQDVHSENLMRALAEHEAAPEMVRGQLYQSPAWSKLSLEAQSGLLRDDPRPAQAIASAAQTLTAQGEINNPSFVDTLIHLARRAPPGSEPRQQALACVAHASLGTDLSAGDPTHRRALFLVEQYELADAGTQAVIREVVQSNPSIPGAMVRDLAAHHSDPGLRASAIGSAHVDAPDVETMTIRELNRLRLLPSHPEGNALPDRLRAVDLNEGTQVLSAIIDHHRVPPSLLEAVAREAKRLSSAPLTESLLEHPDLPGHLRVDLIDIAIDDAAERGDHEHVVELQRRALGHTIPVELLHRVPGVSDLEIGKSVLARWHRYLSSRNPEQAPPAGDFAGCIPDSVREQLLGSDEGRTLGELDQGVRAVQVSNEARELLDRIEAEGLDGRLRNAAYAALVKLNELSDAEYGNEIAHPGTGIHLQQRCAKLRRQLEDTVAPGHTLKVG